jgi:fructose/tagatose bisphosphate aldolase
MPLITDRQAVLDLYAEAAQRRWVIPSFCSENLTTTEAILAAAQEYGRRIGRDDLPVTVAITNQYNHRSQSKFYTHTRRWDIGLKLFLADLRVLTGPGSPFNKLSVIVHLDHTQWDNDAELLQWDMGQFSMIMYDASELPFDANIARTAEFVEKHGREIVIEGACDEIVDATGEQKSALTNPEMARRYLRETGVDYIVANLGTEHRASAADLKYHSDLARRISAKTGPKLVLHGTSSVGQDQVRDLFADGVAKVNIWTSLERDSSPALFSDMVANAAKIIGPAEGRKLLDAGLLGPNCDLASRPSLAHYTTTYRQQIVFEEMKKIVMGYFELWYV